MNPLRMAREGVRFLGHSKRRTALMLLGPLVGVAALVAVVASARGSSEAVQRRLRNFGDRTLMVFAGDVGTVHGPGGEHATTLKVEDGEAIRAEVPGVAAVSPTVRERDVPVAADGQATTAPVFGVTADFGAAWNWPMASGEAINEEDVHAMRPVCVVGRTTARKLFGDEDPIGRKLRVGARKFTVQGVLSSKGSSPRGGDMDDRVMVPITTAMRRMFNRDHIGMIRVLLTGPEQIGPAKEAITALLRARHHIVPPEVDDFEVVTPDMVAGMVRSAQGTLGLLLLVLAGISLLAGGVVVMNVMVVSVRERRKEIGLRRAVGASRGDIRTQFLCEAAAVTLLGGVFGAALGTGASFLLRYLWKMPMLLTWEPYALAAASSLVVGLLFGAWPARTAARLPPVDALRG
ncbi:MAG: ABC transporter permease [Deltaproteobacteria bacterium]|nr:ABC transporter permease [Deltaproteobacteria bacterium]